jgi:hypothetical protein
VFFEFVLRLFAAGSRVFGLALERTST